MTTSSTSSFSKEDAVKALTVLGLPLGEAKTYTSLVGEGSSQATSLAEIAEVPQPKIYGYLESLVKRNFVTRQVKKGKPDTFTAVPYDSVIDTLEDEITSKIKDTKKYFKEIREREKIRQVEDLFSYYEGSKTVSAGLKTVFDMVQENIITIIVNEIHEKQLQNLYIELRKEKPSIVIQQLEVSDRIYRLPPIKKLVNTEGFSGLLTKRPTMFFTDVDFESKSCSSMNLYLPPIDDFGSVLINIKHPVALHFQIQLFDGLFEMLEKQGMFMKEL
jgi:sugar-specific transcriptional regulator TrmB